MKKKIALFVAILLNVSIIIKAQNNFSFTPEKPKPGDKISFSYNPPKQVFNETDEIKCIAYSWGTYEDEYGFATGNKPKPKEIVLKKNGNSYEGTVTTDDLSKMLSFSFSAGELKWKRVENKSILTSGKVDDNNNEGYCIQLSNNDGKECKYSNYFRGEYLLLPSFNYIGIANPEKAAEYMIRELELYPDSKYYVFGWLSNALRDNPDKLKTLASKEIEKLFASGLKTEPDWSLMSTLSSAMKLKEQASYFYNQSKEKFKYSGGFRNVITVLEQIDEKGDINKNDSLINELSRLFNNLSYDDKAKFAYSYAIPYTLLNAYVCDLLTAGRWDAYKTHLEKYKISRESDPYHYYFTQRMIDTLIGRGLYREYAEQLTLENYTFFSGRLSKLIAGVQLPPVTGDEYLTTYDRINSITTAASVFSDLYAQILTRKGEYKKAWPYAKEAQKYLQMLKTDYYGSSDINTRYCLLAEKVLNPKECKTVVEKVVASGQYKPETIDVLKRIYVKEKKSENGFEEYVKTLKQARLEEIKKTLLTSQLNEVAPGFALNDIDGKPVNIADLKGKTLVVDFWATWCGPCKASFPGMQKLVTHYKNNPDVKFLFVDTWQREENDEAKFKAVSEYIASSGYSFHVLLDNKSKVVEDFKVSGIPTKFIIDKTGNIRYKVVGFEADEGKLFDEMNVMIESIK